MCGASEKKRVLGSVLQCVAVCCSVLQCVAVCCSVLHCIAVYCRALQSVVECADLWELLETFICVCV